MTVKPKIDPEFFEALQAEDDLGMVVRALIHIEAGLQEFVRFMALFPERLPKRLSYWQWVDRAHEVGLKAKFVGPLKELGNIRNDFAHKLDATLTSQRLNQVYSKFAIEEKSHLQDVLVEMNKVGPNVAGTFSELIPRDQFILMALTLKSMVTVAAFHAATNAGNAAHR